MKVVISREAEVELGQAFNHYSEISPAQLEHLLHDFHKAIRLISKFPSSSQIVWMDFRRCLLSRFPYGIIYLHGPHRIEIVAFNHLKKKPGYWKGRAKLRKVGG